MFKIDAEAYAIGRGKFDGGASLKSVFETFVASEPSDEVKEISAVLGFVDALVDRIRRS